MTIKQWDSADLFCGSGGATESFRKAIARLNGKDPARMTVADWEAFMQAMIHSYIAVNHWGTAIETHTANYPWARHYHSELANVKPREAIPGGYLDLLLAGPECTFHSYAAGDRPINDQSRITAWQVLDWLDKLYVRCFIIENVPEFLKWGPLNKDGHRNKRLQGAIFLQYIEAIKAMGYKVDYRVLCAADYGDPTSRKRLFIIGRRDGRKLAWPEPTHADPKTVQRLAQPSFFQPARLPWHTAREIIDWTDKGKSIFEKDLSANTMRRIYAGLFKIGLAPLLVTSGGNEHAASSIDVPVPTLLTREQWALAEPYIVIEHNNQTAQSVHDPLGAILAGGTHHGLAQPFLMGLSGATFAAKPRSVDDPLNTILADNRVGVAQPFVLNLNGGKDKYNRVNSVDEPVHTITTTNRPALVQSFIMGIDQSGSHGALTTRVDQPIPTITGKNRFAWVDPYLVAVNHGEELRSASVDDPLATVTRFHSQALAQPYLIQYHGGPTERLASVEDPLHTQGTSNMYGLAQPFIVKYYRTGTAVSIDAPLDTQTAKARFALCVPLMDGWILVDILFRMLRPDELARAHSFPASFVFRAGGKPATKRDTVRMVGNSWPTELGAALVYSALFSTARQ